VEFPTATPVITFHLTPRSAEYWRRWTSQLGALVCGRTLFDFTDALVAVHLGVGLVEPYLPAETMPPLPDERHPVFRKRTG
jgi:hypothetical protein